MTYEVRAEAYSGPLDVLVKLVVSQDVDIWEVSLSRLVDDFVAVMAAADLGTEQSAEQRDAAEVPTFDIDIASEFVLLAATLIELKSRRLLPAEPVEFDLDEELAAYGLRDSTLARLVEGQMFAAAARLLRDRWDAAALRWPRTAGPEERFFSAAPDLLEDATVADVTDALWRVLAPRPVPRVDISHLRAAGISVDEAAEQIVDRLAVTGATTFRELTEHLIGSQELSARLPAELPRDLAERIMVVAYFLALLELFGSGQVELSQAERFGDIGVELTEDGSVRAPAESAEPPLRRVGEDAA